MDKSDFISIAPAYYAAAIAGRIRNFDDKEMTIDELEEYFIQYELGECLTNQTLIDEALTRLSAMGMVEVMADHFGPTHFIKGNHFEEMWEVLIADRASPFYKYSRLTSPNHWIIKAIRRANEVALELGISETDFAPTKIDSLSENNWEPIPLSQEDQGLKSAITSLDKLIAEVRDSNGYAVSNPEERSYVLDGLQATSRTLKEAAATSLPYLKAYAFEPIAVVIKRFGKAAISVSASAAKEALTEFIKQHSTKLFEFLMKHLL